MEIVKNNWKILLLGVLCVVAWFAGNYSGKQGLDSDNGIDFSLVQRNDSIISAQNLIIGDLTKKLNARDSVIVILIGKEEKQRDSVFIHLEDKFEGVPDSTKEALIEEALNAIQ